MGEALITRRGGGAVTVEKLDYQYINGNVIGPIDPAYTYVVHFNGSAYDDTGSEIWVDGTVVVQNCKIIYRADVNGSTSEYVGRIHIGANEFAEGQYIYLGGSEWSEGWGRAIAVYKIG